jgi:hypothetical protein
MATLKFKVDEVLKSIVEHAQQAPHCKVAYRDENTKAPSLWLVKDSGIYLMSAGIPKHVRTAKLPGASVIVVHYAKGFEPDAPDCWDRCREAVGGDDFAVNLDADMFANAIREHAEVVTLNVGKTQIRISYKPGKAVAK